MFHTIISGGTVADGTLTAPRRADVGIQNGKIAAVGDLSHASAEKIISAEGKLVTPALSIFTAIVTLRISAPISARRNLPRALPPSSAVSAAFPPPPAAALTPRRSSII